MTAEGSKKLYNITETGRAYLAEHQDAADAILSQLDQIASKLGRMREAFSGFDEDDDTGGSKEIWLARRELKEALRAARGASGEHKSRIAAILKEAAAKIKGG